MFCVCHRLDNSNVDNTHCSYHFKPNSVLTNLVFNEANVSSTSESGFRELTIKEKLHAWCLCIQHLTHEQEYIAEDARVFDDELRRVAVNGCTVLDFLMHEDWAGESPPDMYRVDCTFTYRGEVVTGDTRAWIVHLVEFATQGQMPVRTRIWAAQF